MSEQIRITRRSIVGFGYTSACENDERGNLRVCSTETPTHTGTARQVFEAIESDRTLASFSGGTFYTTGWFVKSNGAWRKLVSEQYANVGMLFEKNWRDELPAHVLVEVE